MGVPGGARKVLAGMPDSLLRAHRGTHQSRDQLGGVRHPGLGLVKALDPA